MYYNKFVQNFKFSICLIPLWSPIQDEYNDHKFIQISPYTDLAPSWLGLHENLSRILSGTDNTFCS